MRRSAVYILAGLGLLALWLFCRFDLPHSQPVKPLASQYTSGVSDKDESLGTDASGARTQASESVEKVPHHSPAVNTAVPLEQVAAFDRWFTGFRRGEFDLNAANLERGLDLVQQRREAMKELIKTDPAKALALAMPRDLREELPSQIAGQLEKWVEGVGNLEVMIGCFGTNGQSETIRKVRLGDGIYDGYVYGRRLTQATKYKLPINGIAVDNQLALDDKPWRRLEPKEARAAGFDADSTVFKSGQQLSTFTNSNDVEAWKSKLVERESKLGPVLPDGGDEPPPPPGPPPPADEQGWTFGQKGVLWIRVEFPDDPGLPATDQEITNAMAAVSQYYQDVSNGRCSFTTVVLPGAFLLSNTKSFFDADQNSYTQISNEALQKARDYDATHGATGLYNPDIYDRWIVLYKTLTNHPYAGRGMVGGKGIWQNGNTIVGVVAHELGHNHGLWHSHSWQPTSTSTINPGTHVEYGDTFDVMGNSGSFPAGHFNAKQKEILLYLSTNQITTVSNKGTYRIYRHDHRNASGVQAVKVNAGTDYDYWVEYRQQIPYAWFNQTSRLRNGVMLHWGKRPSFTSGSGTYLLDATPLSDDYMADAPFAIGETLTDPSYGIHITPLANGGNAPTNWIDVRVDFGGIGSNHNPVLTFNPPAGTPSARSNITFSASGTDIDSDPVYFRWNFGDGQIVPTTTSPVQYRWLKGGAYNVICTALDGRGGVTAKTNNVSVDDPLVTWARRAEGLTGTATIYGITYGGGQFVAVGRVPFRSVDGATWVNGIAGTGTFGNNFYPYGGVTFGNNRFVTVGQDYSFATSSWYGVIALSQNGITWSNATPANASPFKCVAYGNGRFVAGGENGRMYYSIGGESWIETASPVTNTLRAAQFASGRFVVCGEYGRILTSTNGIDWQNVSVVSSSWFSGVAFFGGNWVVTSGYETWMSSDGTNWNTGSVVGQSASVNSMSAMSQQGLLFCSSYDDSVLWSENASAWVTHKVSSSTNYDSFNGAAEGNGTIVIVGSNGRIFQAGTPRNLAPTFVNASSLSAGISIGKQMVFATSAQGFQNVQLLVNGVVVSQQTGDDPVFTWTPTAFGDLAFSLLATSPGGQIYVSLTNIVTSATMPDWQWWNPNPQVHPLRDIVQGLGRWWGVGDGGAMVTSPDGISWSVMFLADMVNARSVATDGSRLAVVGDVYDSSAGIYRKGILSTTDGLNWQGVNASQLSYADLKGVAYANNLWVAVGASKVFTSSDGLAWTDNALPKQTTFNGVAWGGGRWIVVGNSRTILTSTDGAAWTDVTPTNITSATFYRAAYANGRWVVVGSSGRIANSTNGTNWNSATSGVTSTIYGVADWQGQFIAATSDGKLLSSADGSTWGSVSLSPARSLYAVRSAGSQIVAVGDYGNIFQGNSLATVGVVSGGRHNDIYALLPSDEAVIAGGYGFDSDIGASGAWSGPLAAFLNLANTWQSWTAGTNQQTTIRGLAALGNAYAAVGDSGNIYTSTDRTNWVKQTSGTTSSLRSISAGTSNFVAVGASGRILTSPDGTNWTIQTSPTANTLAAVCYGEGQFVAVGTSGTTLTSPDGINWTTRTNGVTQSLNAIIWANGIGYVAVGTSGTVLTSSNGVSWTRQILDNSDSLSCVASTPWGIVAFTTSQPRAHVSGDRGITWRSLRLPTSAISAAWSDSKGLWIGGTAGRLLYYPFSTQPITSLAFARQGNNLVLSWPTNDPAFKLFYATNLSATTWISNTVAAAIVSGQYTITNGMTNNARFYRLKK